MPEEQCTLTGRFEFRLQRYTDGAEAVKEGVGRRVRISFTGPARLVMD